jgi:hypothetical protein
MLHDPLRWKPRKRQQAANKPSSLAAMADGRRVGDNQLRLLRLLEAKGPWHRGLKWGLGGMFKTAKLADALLTRGLLEVTAHVLVKVRRQGLPADMAPQTREPVFVLSETGRAVLVLDNKRKGLAPQAVVVEHAP